MSYSAASHRWIVALAVTLGTGGLLFLVLGADTPEKGKSSRKGERHLFVWAGDQARKNPDFLMVANFDEKSPEYGKVITTVPLPGPGASGNEPHHVGLSSDGKVLACGGLLSVLKGQKEIFFFDVSDPGAPKFLSSVDPPLSAITDEFHALAQGGFLVTMMGGAQGHHPGRVAEFNRKLELIAEHPQEPPDDGFNPHGISVRPEMNLMVTSDFICPSTTLHAQSGPSRQRPGLGLQAAQDPPHHQASQSSRIDRREVDSR